MTRLSTPVRRAVMHLIWAYEHGDDAQYEAALATLTKVSADLDEAQRAQVAAALQRARQQAEARTHVARVRAALATGTARVVRDLPGGVQVLQVDAEGMDNLVVTVPVPLPGESARVRALVEAGRTAALSGTCPRCGGGLVAQGDQLQVAHRRRCPVEPAALARSR